MRWLALILMLALVGCGSLRPKGIGLDIEFAKSPNAKEAKAYRQRQKYKKVAPGTWRVNDSKNPVLINGTPVDKAKYPAVLRIKSADGAGCTASLVGPQAILTAAHCAEQGSTVSFTTHDGRKFSAVMYRYERWPGDDLDLSVGKVNQPVTGIVPLAVRTDRFEKKGMDVTLIGYGCINPGGTGGNDGVLRIGTAKITAGQGYDLALDGNPSALCYGDSGGPVFFEGKQIGVNSKGNIEDKSYTTRTTLPAAVDFLKAAEAKLGVKICGVSECDGSTPPPGPKQAVFENEDVKVQIFIKR